MTNIHRNNDQRSCGATTIVNGQNSVFINNSLVSVDNDTCSHGAGNLIAQCNNVFINGKLVVTRTNKAIPDGLCGDFGGEHCSPSALDGSENVFVGVK